MKITKHALRSLIREAVGDDKIIAERPWTLEYEFTLSGGNASDSEGKGPDGFAVVMKSGDLEARVVVDSYWNPQSGDASGNSLRLEVDGQPVEGATSYVPTRFDDGKKQLLVISNAPVPGMIVVSHASSTDVVPVAYLVTRNPFDEGDDVEFEVEALGNGRSDVKFKRHVNL